MVQAWFDQPRLTNVIKLNRALPYAYVEKPCIPGKRHGKPGYSVLAGKPGFKQTL